jgi:hypothetical protein
VALPNAQPVKFTPKGLSDAYDASEAFPGACRALANLVFDQGNPELIVCRPGATRMTSFPGFTLPTFVSVHAAIGTVIYGMVSTNRNPGHDEPFAYDTVANAFTTISGVTNANTPTSPALTGAWQPPSMTVVGTKILITHPGFNGSGTLYFGVIDISNPVAPAWSSSNLATNPLPSPPSWVANLNNRAYFAVGNVLYFSDVLSPLVATNAGQSLTLGDPTPIRAIEGLPIQTTSAGVSQALLAFKDFQVWQITGDPTTQNLALNFLSLNVGTSAPRSLVQSPYGVNFMAIDGPYIVDPLGLVRPLTKQPQASDQDIQQPFIYATTPSRVSAGYSGGIYRICLDTTLNGSIATNDYWFDTQRRRWNGPHSFPHDCASQVGSYFVLSHQSKGAALFKSQLFQDATSVYLDDGNSLSFYLESSTFPKDMSMSEKMVVESTIELGVAGGTVSYGITALDEQRNTLNHALINISSSATLWGGSTWGGGLWSSGINIPSVYTIPWTAPLVFQKMALVVTGSSKNNVSIGAFFARYQITGYMNRSQS